MENVDLGLTNEEQSLVQESEKGFAHTTGVWGPNPKEILIFYTSRKLFGRPVARICKGGGRKLEKVDLYMARYVRQEKCL